MENNVPKKRGLLGGLAEKVKMGLAALGAFLGITQITATSFGVLLKAFNDALGVYNAARGSRQSASELVQSTQQDLADWLTVVRGILVGDFGNRWNQQWASAGFVQPSTAIPQRLPDQLSLALQLGKFFTANPSYEIAEKDVTAAQATALREAVLAAEDPLQTAEVELTTAGDSLDIAQTALTAKIRFLIKILSGTLAKDDPRWEAFGLNMPATKATPGAPTGLRATIVGNDIMVECDLTAFADRYRYRGRIVGVETAYRLLASSKTPMAMLGGIEAGATLEIIVQAVNGSAQGVASDPIQVTMPVTAATTKSVTGVDVELAPLTAIQPNGNGNGNGHGSHAVNRLS